MIERVGEMLRDRNLPPLRDTRIELLGAESTYGANARPEAQAVREVVARVGAEHDDPAALQLMMREFASPTTSMSVGSTGWFGGQPTISAVSRVFSVLLRRGRRFPPASIWAARRSRFPRPRWRRPSPPDMVARPAAEPAPMDGGEMAEIPLIDVAWARSGDKGDAFNVGVIARKPEFLPWIRAGAERRGGEGLFRPRVRGGRSPAGGPL